MTEEEKKALILKRDEAIQKIKQAEADIYYLQGYAKALDELIEATNEQTSN